MRVEYDRTQLPKVTGCGLLWECFDPRFLQVDHAYCVMPWPALPHYHEQMVECYRPVSGQAIVWVGDDHEQVASGGPTIFIPPGSPHWTVPMSLRANDPFELEVYNAPGWNSFDPFDFVPLDVNQPSHRECLMEWYLAMAAELSIRRHVAGEGDGDPSAPGMSAPELVAALVLSEYANYFPEVRDDFAAFTIPDSQ